MTAVVEATNLSRWYGPVLGCSDISWKLTGGIVGLLGPNGAGKSTLIKMMAGLLRPSRGTMLVYGGDPFDDPAVRRRIGYAPEHEKAWDDLTGYELVRVMAELAGVPRGKSAEVAKSSLALMGMTDAMNRPVKGYSKGMRQRTKLATAIAHEPDFLLLDEPLTGVDPMARIDILARVKELADKGKTIVISSHVLYEIEALTTEILVVYRGQILAEGNVFDIRKLIDKRPHRIRVQCDRPRDLAARLVAIEHLVDIGFEKDGALMCETRDPDRCYDELARAILETKVVVKGMTSPDNNLSAVFDYLTTARGGE